MNSYDNRRITLDPGLTALALHGLHRRDGHYPFIEGHVRWRGFRVSWPAIRHGLAALFLAVCARFESRPSVG